MLGFSFYLVVRLGKNKGLTEWKDAVEYAALTQKARRKLSEYVLFN